MIQNYNIAASKYLNSHVVRGLSYATVEDFVDSLDNLSDLATKAGDLKDVQRPWAFKTISALLPPGAHLCEVGAGTPYVAAALFEAGYRVTIVDPYDGSGNGPKEYETYCKQFPQLTFVRQQFGPEMPELHASSFDAIYSISVIEHIPLPGIDSLVAGAQKYLKEGGLQVHAIDTVVAGPGDKYHLQLLGHFLQYYEIAETSLIQFREQSLADSETYFLSAEAHNRWRGQMAYHQFPMRKVVSAQVVL
jgi:hypothetical protein